MTQFGFSVKNISHSMQPLNGCAAMLSSYLPQFLMSEIYFCLDFVSNPSIFWEHLALNKNRSKAHHWPERYLSLLSSINITRFQERASGNPNRLLEQFVHLGCNFKSEVCSQNKKKSRVFL